MIRRRDTVSALAMLVALSGIPAAAQEVQDTAPAQDTAKDTVDAQAAPAEEAPRRNINPYDRDIALTVPLNFNSRVLGEMPVTLTRDDRFLVESTGFQALLEPLLLPEAQQELAQALDGHEFFAPEEINDTGIRLDYDPNQLAVMVLRIDPSKRTIESLFSAGQAEEPGLPPERFSAFLNANLVAQKYHSRADMQAPSVFFNGAVRYGAVVLETEVQGRENFRTGEYGFERRYARLVYDQPEQFRRWTVGDLDVDLRGRQGFVEMGGIGVQRQRRRFDPFRNTGLTGSRTLVLQESSTVRVLRNGILVREFRLDPGQYDVANLPLDAGSNDINLEVVNDSGRMERVSYSAYLDMIDLDPGEYEYGAFLGVTSEGFGAEPDYSDGQIAFTGFWRKAFENRPALGLGLQLTEDVQSITGQTQFILVNGARLQVEAGISQSDFGTGYTGGLTFDHIIDRGDTYDSWAVGLEYTSEEYGYLGMTSANANAWAIMANYNHRFTPDLQASLGGSYRISHDDSISDAYNISATGAYRFAPTWSVQVGAEYRDYGMDSFGGQRAQGFGFNIGLIWQPRPDRRMDARYSSNNNAGSVSYQQFSSNRPGSLGYSVTSNYDDGAGSVSGQVDYIANRFDASLTHTTLGRDFSNITDQQVTSVRLGSSIAMAGGKVAIGRGVYDSFAIVYPHETLKGRSVIVGQGLQGGDYVSRGGALGPALAGNLSSYVNQSVKYDVLDPPVGYNIGDGVVRLHPSYKSGYAIEVGSSRFVSALGRLVGNGDRPVALMSGRIRPADEPNAETELFFTNSVGRFAIQDLEPGRRYRIEMFSSPPMGFEFEVPADNEGLLDLKVLRVPLDVPEDKEG